MRWVVLILTAVIWDVAAQLGGGWRRRLTAEAAIEEETLEGVRRRQWTEEELDGWSTSLSSTRWRWGGDVLSPWLSGCRVSGCISFNFSSAEVEAGKLSDSPAEPADPCWSLLIPLLTVCGEPIKKLDPLCPHSLTPLIGSCKRKWT